MLQKKMPSVEEQCLSVELHSFRARLGGATWRQHQGNHLMKGLKRSGCGRGPFYIC